MGENGLAVAVDPNAVRVDPKSWAIVSDSRVWWLGCVWVPGETAHTGAALVGPKMRKWTVDEAPPRGAIRLSPFYEFNRKSGIQTVMDPQTKKPQTQMIREQDLLCPFLFGGNREAWIVWSTFTPLASFYDADIKDFNILIERAEMVRSVLRKNAGGIDLVASLADVTLPPAPGRS